MWLLFQSWIYLFFTCILLSVKIISIILSRVNHKVGENRRSLRKKTCPPASRTWTVYPSLPLSDCVGSWSLLVFLLGLSQMWPELGSNPQWRDDEWFRASLTTLPRGRLSVLNWKNNTYCLNYRNDPKFSDIQVFANSADPDQTSPREKQRDHCLISTVCHSVCIFWTHYLMAKQPCSTIQRWLQQIYWVSEFLR